MIPYPLVRKDRRDELVSVEPHLLRDKMPASVTTITTEQPAPAMKRFAEARLRMHRLGVPDNNDGLWSMAGRGQAQTERRPVQDCDERA